MCEWDRRLCDFRSEVLRPYKKKGHSRNWGPIRSSPSGLLLSSDVSLKEMDFFCIRLKVFPISALRCRGLTVR
jgi:hypothetical protein